MKKLVLLSVVAIGTSSCTEIRMLQMDVATLSATVEAMNSDSDKDGVADYFDVDNETPAGVQVAGNGAALDSDGDGVANHLDAEPFTAKGARVDASGAALDSDGDGVADGLDVEKNTAPGAMVNFKGQTVGVANAAGGAAALLPSIYFKFGSASLTPTAYEQLTTVARYLSANPNMKLEIRGYCDPVGSEKYNQGLAERRASSVKSALSDVFKIESTRLSVNALGENDSLTDEYSINRRVDFVFN